MERAHSAVFLVLLVMLQSSTMGQLEMNLEEKDLNSSPDSSDNSTDNAEKEINMGFWTENTKCTPGRRPDPGSCSRYFLCVEVLPSVFREFYMYCPLNLVYNSHTSECVSSYFYQCAGRGLHRPHPIRPPKPPPFYPPICPPPIWVVPPWPIPPPPPPPPPTSTTTPTPPTPETTTPSTTTRKPKPTTTTKDPKPPKPWPKPEPHEK